MSTDDAVARGYLERALNAEGRIEIKEECLRELMLYLEQDRCAETDPPRTAEMMELVGKGLSA